MTAAERQEACEKALRRAWREFEEKVAKTGMCTCYSSIRDETTDSVLKSLNFTAHVVIQETAAK